MVDATAAELNAATALYASLKAAVVAEKPRDEREHKEERKPALSFPMLQPKMLLN